MILHSQGAFSLLRLSPYPHFQRRRHTPCARALSASALLQAACPSTPAPERAPLIRFPAKPCRHRQSTLWQAYIWRGCRIQRQIMRLALNPSSQRVQGFQRMRARHIPSARYNRGLCWYYGHSSRKRCARSFQVPLLQGAVHIARRALGRLQAPCRHLCRISSIRSPQSGKACCCAVRQG